MIFHKKVFFLLIFITSSLHCDIFAVKSKNILHLPVLGLWSSPLNCETCKVHIYEEEKDGVRSIKFNMLGIQGWDALPPYSATFENHLLVVNKSSEFYEGVCQYRYDDQLKILIGGNSDHCPHPLLHESVSLESVPKNEQLLTKLKGHVTYKTSSYNQYRLILKILNSGTEAELEVIDYEKDMKTEKKRRTLKALQVQTFVGTEFILIKSSDETGEKFMCRYRYVAGNLNMVISVTNSLFCTFMSKSDD